MLVCGYAAPDSFVLSMTLHVCGQLAVLSCKIENLLQDHVNYNRHIRTIIMRHHQLITLAEILESNYNMIFLQQTLGTVFLLCLTTYHIVANTEHGDNTNSVSFLLCACSVFSTILAYCYIGECLITESDVGHIEDLFVHLERIFSVGGIWPFERTYVRFAIYITYFTLYLIMAYANLWDVLGNLELMVMNLVETVAYSITFPMVWVIRCSGLLKRVIVVVRKDMVERKFEDPEEERIYHYYNYTSKIFLYGSTVGMFITVMLLYFRPLMSFSSNDQEFDNSTNSFVLPYRIHTFYDIANTRTYVLMYLYLFPMFYNSMCHMAAICLLVILVFHICGELSILSYRIKNVQTYSQDVLAARIRDFVRMHLKIIWMAKSVDDTFNMVLMDELFGNSVILAISMYYVLMNLKITELATCCTFIFFAAIALVMLYGYCLIGEQLTQQCVSVQDAYYQCNWYEMPFSCKRCLLICMLRGQVMLYLTAGKFYIFSLNGFTDDQKDLDRAAQVLSWNKRLMSTLGLWPFRNNNLIFTINYSYFGFLMILEFFDLFLFIDNLEHIIMNLTENMAFLQILVRMSTLRLYNGQIGEVIAEIMKDFDRASYRTFEEMKTFISYNARSKVFMKLLMVFVALTASSYYLTPIIIILGSGLPRITIGENVTRVIYLLPYRFHVFYAVEDLRTYVITYVLEFPFVFISGFGQTAADCVMVTLSFHICGQMSVLALRINNIDTDPLICGREIRNVVRTHIRLLRMGKMIEKIFSITLLVNLIGATSLLCILGYQILTNYAKGERGVLVMFLIFQFLVLLILYALCTVGENLLTESSKVCEAFYHCNWYNMSKENARIIILCMARSQKPLCLKAGKFSIFCLSTLTDSLKTSMGYLSVLRSFL
ncbi:uncharacterized protein LOC116844231 [Odontomachus brunneus]|uniref:uncharacterized protein LOC116844231 n=1 Tax=Odontomachus brunneus TaxID=486640 RepID=UPI0013F270B9|nr:uncharacterized protein LOC116844231 [Odontomachus brunneus]